MLNKNMNTEINKTPTIKIIKSLKYWWDFYILSILFSIQLKTNVLYYIQINTMILKNLMYSRPNNYTYYYDYLKSLSLYNINLNSILFYSVLILYEDLVYKYYI